MPKFEYANDIIKQEENTRLPGQPAIIIDKREFRSQLPAKLYFAGFKLVPVFLEVGDYILTDVIERKSVPTGDLFESIKIKGRLDQQLKRMSQNYKISILLIDFENEQEFNEESLTYNEFSTKFIPEQTQNDKQYSTIQFNISLIASKYTNVTLFWAKGYNQTVKFFTYLKKNQPQPSIQNIKQAKDENLDENLYSKDKQKYIKDFFQSIEKL